jgi:hypothetical protein
MTALFDLDDDDNDMVNAALLQHAGQSINDIQRELFPFPE